MVMGHISMGMSHVVDGDYPAGIESFQRALKVSADPFYTQFSRVFLGFAYVYNGQYEQAEEALSGVEEFSQAFGVEILGTMAKACLGVISLTKGDLSIGMKMLEACERISQDKERKYFGGMVEFILGEVYLQIVQKAAPIRLSTMARNIGFLAKNVPFAGQKSKEHFDKLIELANDIGAHGMLGPAYLDLGLLHKEKGRREEARECISKAIKLFEQSEAETYLKRANEALTSLGKSMDTTK
jgi:tetratricopeptide (TPR) repeat protein